MLGTTRTAVILVCNVSAGYFVRPSHSKSRKAFMWDLGDRETASNLFFLFGRKAAGWCLCADDTFKQEIIQGLLH